MAAIDNIKKWAEDGTELGVISWNELPEINLYMDQVISLLTEKLSFFAVDEEDKLLTKSMINNYVKSGLIPHPEKKKYNKEQLSQLIVISMLKQVLSIPDLNILLAGASDSRGFYEIFERTQTEAMNDVGAQLRFAVENGDNMKLLALKLAAEANAKRAAAEKILHEIGKEN